MKVVTLANGDFAAPSFEAIASSEHEAAALFVFPLRGKTRKKTELSAVRRIAQDHAIPVVNLADINTPEGIELLKSFSPDILFICDYGKILHPDVIAAAPYGGVNLHGSLLPRYRGAAPVHRAILAGETIFGVSVIHIVPQVDAGPVILSAKDPVSYDLTEQQTVVEIEERLSRLGAPLVLRAFDLIASGKAQPLPQNDRKATRAPKIRKEEGRIDWSKTMLEIINQYRAFQPWPKTFSDWTRDGKPPMRLILGPFTRTVLTPPDDAKIGEVIRPKAGRLLIRCGDGVLQVDRIQPAGKRVMTGKEFLIGYRMADGEIFR
ncbi:MAG: methionyl-tRNA formyltransferase [Thermoguttaceae bacterium]|nr:methionyl-tRNA formyltransferase [Thermoguttaceae bacterium]MBQ6619958.1 methionyl-tRNA formyltransferase [Thermoguttaceae bacterium]